MIGRKLELEREHEPGHRQRLLNLSQLNQPLELRHAMLFRLWRASELLLGYGRIAYVYRWKDAYCITDAKCQPDCR